MSQRTEPLGHAIKSWDTLRIGSDLGKFDVLAVVSSDSRVAYIPHNELNGARLKASNNSGISLGEKSSTIQEAQ